MILITFALPHESGRFLPALQNKIWIKRGPLPILTGSFAGHNIMVLHTGIGPVRAKNQCGEILDQNVGGIELVIAAGYGGGLDERLGTGDLLIAENFSDPALVAIAQEDVRVGKLTTQRRVAETVEVKKLLAIETGAMAVDMETEAIYQQCVQFKIPMLAIRAISDPIGIGMPIPGEVWFDEARQKPRVLALLTHLALNPAKIPRFGRFVNGTSLARTRLADFLKTVLLRYPAAAAPAHLLR